MSIGGISPIGGGAVPQTNMPASVAGGTAAAPAGQGSQLQAGDTGLITPGSSILAMSSTSISASMETLTASNSPMLANNDALGAALLLLVLQYMQESDPTQKQNLLSTIMSIAGGQQQGGNNQSSLMYSSSSLSIESTQLVMIGSGDALGAYSGASAGLQQVPQSDSGAAGLNVLA